MELNRNEQRITLDGTDYSRDDIHRLVAEMVGETTTETTPETPAMLRELYLFLEEWFSDSPLMTVQTSGSTGKPKLLTVRKEQMMQSARTTCEVLNLRAGDTALLCMPLAYIAGKMMVVRALVAGLNLIVRTPSGHPLAGVSEKIRFAAMVPLQVYNTFDVEEELKRLRRVGILIIGGGMINPHFDQKIMSLPGEVYATYGMTETLSHIALCRLNGDHTDRITYYPLPGVKLSISSKGTLKIDAPLVCDEVLTTNDVAEIGSDGGFIVLGRRDTTINSGGIKMQPELMEGWLQSALPMPFVFTSIPDERLGEAVVLLVEGAIDIAALRSLVAVGLPTKYGRPKWIIPVPKVPLTGYGKINRVACKALARTMLDAKIAFS